MDIIQQMDLATSGEIAVSAVLIGIVVQLLKKFTKLSSDWASLLALVLGAIAGLVAVLVSKETNYLGGAITGIVLGATASGLFDTGKSVVSTVTAKVSDSKQAKADELVAMAQSLAGVMQSRASDTSKSAAGVADSEEPTGGSTNADAQTK